MEDTTVTMKANRMHVFGGPEVILFEDVPPTPGTGEALVTSFRTGSVQTNWMRIPDMPSLIQVATNPGGNRAGDQESVGECLADTVRHHDHARP